MFLDPNKLDQSTPTQILESAASGYLGLDHRFLHALLDRPEESLPAVLAFSERDRNRDPVDIAPELIAILRFWKTPEAVPFLVRYIKEDPEDVPDEVIETLVETDGPRSIRCSRYMRNWTNRMRAKSPLCSPICGFATSAF